MIVGIGIDIVNIDRIAAALERFGDRFRNRVFTLEEQALADGVVDANGVFAKRWAAKEACSKALGTGMRQGVAWRDISIGPVPGGGPRMTLTGKSRDRLLQLIPAGCSAQLHVSMSDDHPWATASVIIEALPDHAGD